MIKKRIIYYIILIVMLIVIWNIIWPIGFAIYMRSNKSLSESCEYNGGFHGKYIFNYSDPEVVNNYVKNPIISPLLFPYNTCVINIRISPSKFIISNEVNGYFYEREYDLGTDVHYMGDNLFSFCYSNLNFGQIIPGTTYSYTECEVQIIGDKLKVDAVDYQIGMVLFLFPVIQKTSFNQMLESSEDDKNPRTKVSLTLGVTLGTLGVRS